MKTVITIITKLTRAQRRAINRAAYDGSWSDTSRSWSHIGRNRYGALGDDPHLVARTMMLAAHTTFRYELSLERE